jgi:lycopene cyclase domain-containing protein
MSLYLLLNIIAISIPLLLSFDKKVHFYTHWKYLFPAMILTLVIFVIWDVIFTANGIWSFNERYLIGLELLGLPLEEYLFFLTIPYASLFTVYVLAAYFPQIGLNHKQTGIVTLLIIAFLGILAAIYLNRAYTAVNFIFTVLVLGLVYLTRREILSQFYFSYLVILIPFGIINGILTGSFIEDQVVWYNDNENLGFRLGTIPFEDIFYGMSLILLNYYLTETFRNLASRKKQGGT